MATIEELYNQSGYSKLADKSKDKTPLSVDSKKLQNTTHYVDPIFGLIDLCYFKSMDCRTHPR